MIAEAVHRGETVFNIALRIDPDSLMRAAAFQLVRNVLHAIGTVIALRPEDNLVAANAEIIEAAVATPHPEDKIVARCKIPSIVSDLRVARISPANTPEQELLADLLEAQSIARLIRSVGSGDGDQSAQSVGR